MILDSGSYSGAVMQKACRNGLIVSITAYYKTGFDNQYHCHQNTNISFVIQGGCDLKKKNSHEFLPGEIVFNHAGEYHQVMEVAECSRHINLEIEDSFLKEYNLTEGNLLASIQRKPDYKFLMLRILQELNASDHLSLTSIHMLLLELAHHPQEIKYSDPSLWPAWVRVVKDYLNDNWNNPISLTHLAMAANTHPVTISKYFSRYFSCSLGEYMRKIKIEKALALIKTSGQTLTNVAYECGFADQSHFTRTFKEFTGFLPFAYKNL